MTPTMFTRLQKASDFVIQELEKSTPAEDIIKALVEQHHATLRLRAAGDTLRCAGVTGSCTWSRSDGLLSAWRKNATIKIAMENQK